MSTWAILGAFSAILMALVWALVREAAARAKAEAVMERHRANIEALDRALKAGRDAAAAPPDELLLDDGFRRD